MEPALIVIVGFMGPLIVIGIIGLIVMHYLGKKEQPQP